jgi:hypothetical protein
MMDEGKLLEFFTMRFNNLETKLDGIFTSLRVLEGKLSENALEIAELKRQMDAAWKKIDANREVAARLGGALELVEQLPLKRKAEAVDKLKGYVWAGIGVVISGLAAALIGFATGFIKPR